jgi:HEPN domain-containing protein
LKNTAMAEAYIRQAMERLKHAREALRRGNYPYVVRQSQEAVELALKASLRLVGVEPPRWHDVGPVLRRETGRFPEWFREEIPRLARISRRLRREREPSMYGDEESGIPLTSSTIGGMPWKLLDGLVSRYVSCVGFLWSSRGLMLGFS